MTVLAPDLSRFRSDTFAELRQSMVSSLHLSIFCSLILKLPLRIVGDIRRLRHFDIHRLRARRRYVLLSA
jgi:hypothetical protein